LHVEGNYGDFLEVKEQYLHAQGKRQESLANRVSTEIQWLRRGAKARTRKSKARIGKAGELMSELESLNTRTRTSTTDIDFSATNRRTKQLIEADSLGYSIGDRSLFKNLDFSLKPGMRIGLVGPNGSGKTTLLRLIRGDIQPDTGNIRRADQLKIVYFDQRRELDPNLSLRRALAPDSDSVVYQERVIHIASWAARFLFTNDSLNQPIGRLSGGERARVLIAQLMLQPADVLLLDEPTNDLDIPTLEILEESLLEFRGALMLVTHDRFMMDRVSTGVHGMDGLGGIGVFADYLQWEEWQRTQQAESIERPRSASTEGVRQTSPKKKLSYIEAREFSTIEGKIAEAEGSLRATREALNDPAVASDSRRLQMLLTEIDMAQTVVDQLYARWAELEEKKAKGD
jgi:ATP-binding cassette subfamily F protein uup